MVARSAGVDLLRAAIGPIALPLIIGHQISEVHIRIVVFKLKLMFLSELDNGR